MAGNRYGGVLAGSALLLAAGAVLAYLALRDGRRDAFASELAPIGEAAGVSFSVKNEWQIRPDVAAYARFAAEDSAWRAAQAELRKRVGLESYTYASGGTWVMSPEQAMRDSVWTLVQAGDLPAASRVLAAWLARRPGDAGARLELARMLVQLRRTDDAAVHYRALLAANDDPDIRREYAASLLWGDRYDAAAREFAALVARDSSRTDSRLGLAQALAWGGRSRDAERELRWLAQRLPADTGITSLLRGARAGFEPGAEEARAWVAADPGYTPYRLAFARALVREGRFAEAGAAYDSVLAAGDPAAALLAEAAAARGAAGDSLGATRLLARAVLREPADTSLRRRWAEALAWSGDRVAAIAQYGELLKAGERADLLLARGRLHAWSGAFGPAARDLARSAELQPTADAFSLLGDVERWRGRHAAARRAYDRALALRPGDPVVLASLDDLEREERLLAVGTVGQETGWAARAGFSEDNTGFLFLSAGLTRGFALGRSTVLTASLEQRRVSQRSVREPERYVYGIALGAGASQWIGRALHASVQAGIVRHGVGRDVGYGSLAVTATLPRGASATAQVGTGPLYGPLMSLEALAGWRTLEFERGRPLTGRTASLAVTVPVSRASVTAAVEELQLADGNRRRGVTATVRMPLGNGFSALYSGGTLGYSGRSDTYWDPVRYTSHSAGVEYAWSNERGVRLAARVLPGVGRTTEAIVAPGGGTARLAPVSAPQLSTSGEASLRRGRWDLGVTGGYGRGREGSYQQLQGSVRVKLDW